MPSIRGGSGVSRSVSNIFVLQDLGGFWRAQKQVIADIWVVLHGKEQKAVRLALWIALIDQAMGSTAIVNYAPQACSQHRMSCCLPCCTVLDVMTASVNRAQGLSAYAAAGEGRRARAWACNSIVFLHLSLKGLGNSGKSPKKPQITFNSVFLHAMFATV